MKKLMLLFFILFCNDSYSADIKKAVTDIKSGLVEIRNDKDGNLASTIGRKSYSTEKLLENFFSSINFPSL